MTILQTTGKRVVSMNNIYYTIFTKFFVSLFCPIPLPVHGNCLLQINCGNPSISPSPFLTDDHKDKRNIVQVLAILSITKNYNMLTNIPKNDNSKANACSTVL